MISILPHQTDTAWIDALWQTALTDLRAVALWRRPHESTHHLMVDLREERPPQPAELETLSKGFLVSPFDNPQAAHTFHIRADVHVCWSDAPASAVETISARAGSEAFVQRATQRLGEPRAATWSAALGTAPAAPEADTFRQQVGAAVAAIRRGDFRKVVLARRKAVALPADYDPVAGFRQLCAAHPGAFVSLFFLPGHGLWLTATPETLVSVDADGIFRTMALAGTQPRPEGRISSAVWTQKEIEEQALVSRYIINCFKQIRLREFEEEGPRTVAAGHLLHLRTDFAVDTVAQCYPQLGTVMLGLLHPTSAVCGLPKAPALAFIRAHETFDRALYSGFLGPVNVNNRTDLFVHLRCAQLQPGRAWLYAGAGITADSDPDKEWHETELKTQTLHRVLVSA